MKQDSPSALDPAALPDTRTKQAPPLPQPSSGAPRHKTPGWVWLALLVLIGAGAYYFWSKKSPAASGTAAGKGAAHTQKGRGFGAIPIVAAKARRGNIPVYFTGLGAVTPIYTVDIKSRVDGELMKIYFKEGDTVHKGDPLVEIDPRPYQVQLTQAEGQLIRDQALLENARVDLARYKTLLAQNAVPEQQVVTQDSLVKQEEGIVKADQGMIDSAKLNLVYAHILAPITGRLGLRLVDPGNIVHASDANPMLVITQIDPISVIFTLAEDQLPVVTQKFWAGQRLVVEAWDRTPPPLSQKLATGTLTTLDNQIDQTTGTLKLRATFDNKNGKLFPNQFVNVRLLVQLKQNVTLIPTATVQRNSQTTYVFLVRPDSKATVRPITVGTTEGDETEVTSGLNPGDVVVMTGVDKLQEGTQVIAHFAGETGRAPGRPGAASQAAGAPPAGQPATGGRPARKSK
ncbi:MAG TPA: MdtA/MuxA family multidrug efflux RND transporter periplasmic adaptor subunit [Bryobacteraceae bacterium]|nr:MdtA/MuxA family multidrug efflux RND transporter periplasmic adaptor subunit [Bryobacteraceae bacterium]